MLAPVGGNKVTGSGELWVTLTGNTAKFTLQVGGLLAGAPHASVLYAGAKGACPTQALASDTAASGRSPRPTPRRRSVRPVPR